MSGKVGRSGRKPKPVGALRLSGGFRRDRHAHRDDEPARVTPPKLPTWIGANLQPAGLAFVRSLWREYENWSADASVLLRQAGTLIDHLAALDAALGAEGALVTDPLTSTTHVHPLVKPRATALRQLQSLIAAMGLSS